jgi:ubiquinone biosynthesis monooxygenase Coq7
MSLLDSVLVCADNALRTVFAPARAARPTPKPGNEITGSHTAEAPEPSAAMQADALTRAARLMRINHVGEICAQALYQGQSLTARNDHVRTTLQKAAKEEEDHLAWCEERINELGGRKSLLNPLWYAGSFALGAASGLLGDKWNLAFLAETERQVEGHLKDHLEKLPPEDARSRAVLEQMQRDEAQHAATAMTLGAADMPQSISRIMRLASRVMTGTAYWV